MERPIRNYQIKKRRRPIPGTGFGFEKVQFLAHLRVVHPLQLGYLKVETHPSREEISMILL